MPTPTRKNMDDLRGATRLAVVRAGCVVAKQGISRCAWANAGALGLWVWVIPPIPRNF